MDKFELKYKAWQYDDSSGEIAENTNFVFSPKELSCNSEDILSLIQTAKDDYDFHLLLLNDFRCFTNPKVLQNYLKKVRGVHSWENKELDEKFSTVDFGKWKPILTLYHSDAFQFNDERKFQYFDSSIWQRWVDLKIINQVNTKECPQIPNCFYKNLCEILCVFQKCKEAGIYKDFTALEFCEFETRLYLNAFIPDLGSVSSGHSKSVIPFLFGSESRFKKETENKINELNHNPNFEFTALLVDDKGYVAKLGGIKRVEWVKEILKPIGEFTIKQLTDIEEIPNEDQKKGFDFYLLDYLLNKKNDGSRFTGIDFLNNYLQSDVKIYHKSVLEMYWVCLSSSYSHAFLDDIKQSGLQLYNKNWVIERGSSPFYTPEAFKYALICLIESIYDELLPEGGIWKIWEDGLSQLDISTNGEMNFSRFWANTLLTKMLSFNSNLDFFKELRTNSKFAISFFESNKYKVYRIKNFSTGLFGYATQLLYLLSYSNGYDWDDMLTNLELIREMHQKEENRNYKTYTQQYNLLYNRIDSFHQ